jgi:hypothetical protein
MYMPQARIINPEAAKSKAAAFVSLYVLSGNLRRLESISFFFVILSSNA